MKKLVFPESTYEQLTTELAVADGTEASAVAFTRPARWRDGERLLVNEVRVAAPGDYLERSASHVLMRGDWALNALVHAQRTGMGVVFIHSHPHQEVPAFSLRDDQVEARLAQLLTSRAPGRTHLSLVVAAGGPVSRELGRSEPLEIWTVGSRLERRDHGPTSSAAWSGGIYDRQVMALGEAVQEILASLRVAIVGLGGTGSMAAQQLAYLGCQDFLLLDPQALEDTNLNRVVGAYPGDESKPKVEIAARMIRAIRPGATIQAFEEDVCERSSAERLRDVDMILVCTDSQGSRAVINRLAYQYLIPAVDMGTQIRVRDSGTRLFGRVQLLAPGLPCLHCYDALNSEAVRLDLLTAEARAADPYDMAEVKQPAVISINGVSVSLAVTMLLQTITPLEGGARSLRYEGVEARVKAIQVSAQPRCPDCAPRFCGHGDAAAILARQQAVRPESLA